MNLTRTQRRVLNLLLNPDLDLVYERGGGWWIGDEKTNGKLAKSLLQKCFVRLEDYPNDNLYRYTINESGRRALAGEKPYSDGRGRYFGTLEELMAAN